MNPSVKQPTNYSALTTLVVVFFFWGFIAAGNSVFIPFCKHKFHLDQFQSQLIDFAFYLAYYVGALLLFAYGALVEKIWWANGAIKKYRLWFIIFGYWCSHNDYCSKCQYLYRNVGWAFCCGFGV